MIAKTIAKALLRAIEIHEGSYDRKAADHASATQKYPDYASFYAISQQQACLDACTEIGEPALGFLLYLALDAWWNDCNDWAQEHAE